MSEYISREEALMAVTRAKLPDTTPDGVPIANGKRSVADCVRRIKDIPAADVLPRDEAIKMGAELAAMHGSDATSQQLEEAYLKGVEYGMTRRDVRPVVRGKWLLADDGDGKVCGICKTDYCDLVLPVWEWNFCPNCGADMRVEEGE